MKNIVSANAPAPIGPYSQAMVANGFLFASGQIALDPATGELVLDDIRTEATRVMENIKAVLAEAGTDFSRVVKTNIYLKDLGDFAAVNEVYAPYMSQPYPARDTIQVAALPKNVNVEIAVIALVG